MSEHSLEPWTLETGVNNLDTPDGERWVSVVGPNRELLIYDSARGSTGEQILANLERVVACVNACAGFTNEQLKAVGKERCLLVVGHPNQLADAPYAIPDATSRTDALSSSFLNLCRQAYRAIYSQQKHLDPDNPGQTGHSRDALEFLREAFKSVGASL